MEGLLFPATESFLVDIPDWRTEDAFHLFPTYLPMFS